MALVVGLVVGQHEDDEDRDGLRRDDGLDADDHADDHGLNHSGYERNRQQHAATDGRNRRVRGRQDHPRENR